MHFPVAGGGRDILRVEVEQKNWAFETLTDVVVAIIVVVVTTIAIVIITVVFVNSVRITFLPPPDERPVGEENRVWHRASGFRFAS
jgi:hypothetical protein